MTAEAAEKLKKVQKYSASLRNLFRFFFVLGALALVVETGLVVSGAERFDTSVRIGNTEYSGDSIPGTIRAIAFIGFVLASGILLKLNLHLVKLFGLYADGKIFSAENVDQIRQIGITMLFFPALWVLSLFVPLFVLGEGLNKTITTGGWQPFSALIVGTIVIVVSWIMDVGRELREEQDLVV
jgi:hypothetical protein